MITDKLLRVSDGQAITTTAVSTDKIDLSQARDIGEGENLYMHFGVPVALAGGTSVNFEVVIADDAALTTNVEVVGASGAVLTAALVAGYSTAVRINPRIGSLGRRYMGARYTVAGTYTAGNVTSDIVLDIQDGRKSYASGFTVA
jgi:hypothetical protein